MTDDQIQDTAAAFVTEVAAPAAPTSGAAAVQEMRRILELRRDAEAAVRDAADERQRASVEADAILGHALADAERLSAETDELVAERKREAEAVAARILEEARLQAEEIATRTKDSASETAALRARAQDELDAAVRAADGLRAEAAEVADADRLRAEAEARQVRAGLLSELEETATSLKKALRTYEARVEKVVAELASAHPASDDAGAATDGPTSAAAPAQTAGSAIEIAAEPRRRPARRPR